jgi:integrase
MKMKLKKRGKIWWIDYRANGKRYRQSTGTTKREVAVAWMNQIDVARKMPTFEAAVDVLRHFYDKPVEGVIPIGAIWSTYEELARATGKANLAAGGLERRKNQVQRFLRWLAEKRPTIQTLEHITGPVAAGFASHLAASGLKSKTRANIIGELTTVWKMLEKASQNVQNPWRNLSPPDTDGERGKAFSPAQEADVLAAAKKIGKDWFDVCQVMRFTGLRYGDVARLEWSEIDGDVIRLLPNKTKRHKIAVAIPIVAELQAVLAARSQAGAYLFPIHAELYGNRGRAAREALNFAEVLKAANVTGKGYTIHSWRHTAATKLARTGADIETRKRILGHTEDITARRYDHDDHLAETRAALEAAAN